MTIDDFVKWIYPAGIYNNTTKYTCDDLKAPYVLDTTADKYYVLNAKMTRLGTEQGNLTPSQSNAQSGTQYWVAFDMLEAVYTKLLMTPNALLGSFVFNGDYMFSQYGKTQSGNSTNHYEEFGTDKFLPNFQLNGKTGSVILNDVVLNNKALRRWEYVDLSGGTDVSILADTDTYIRVINAGQWSINDGSQARLRLRVPATGKKLRPGCIGHVTVLNAHRDPIEVFAAEESYRNYFVCGAVSNAQNQRIEDIGVLSFDTVVITPGTTFSFECLCTGFEHDDFDRPIFEFIPTCSGALGVQLRGPNVLDSGVLFTRGATIYE